MSRKKSGNGNDGILIVLALIVVGVIVATPVAMLGGFLYFQSQAAISRRKMSKNVSDYWLDKNTKEIFKKATLENNKFELEISSLIKQGEESGVSKNQDGSFSARSALGKELKANIESLNSKYEKNENILKEIKNWPQRVWRGEHFEYNENKKHASCFLWGLVSCLISVSFYVDKVNKIYSKDIISAYWSLVTYFIDAAPGKIHLTQGHFKALFIVTALTLLAYFFRKKVLKKKEIFVCEKPEIVSLENLEKYQ